MTGKRRRETGTGEPHGMPEMPALAESGSACNARNDGLERYCTTAVVTGIVAGPTETQTLGSVCDWRFTNL